MASNKLNFSTDNLITGINIIEGQLYWTDDRNEPRKVNVNRFRAADHSSGITSIYGRSFENRDITVIRPGPTDAIGTTVIADGTAPTAIIPGAAYELLSDDDSDEITGQQNDIEIPGDTSGLEPSVTTLPVTAINATSALLRGQSSDNGLPLIERGFYFGTESNLTDLINNNEDTRLTANVVVEFQRAFYAFASETTYYVVAYARNAAGIVYGDIVSFRTKLPASNGAPVTVDRAVVNTLPATFVGPNSARLEGDIDDKGDSTVTETGFYIGPSVSNTIELLAVPANRRQVAFGSEDVEDQFEFDETGLTIGTTFSFVAYMIVTDGGSSEPRYGNILTFTTGQLRVPTVATTLDLTVSEDNAHLFGLIEDDGGSDVINCGFIVSSQETTLAALSALIGNAGNDTRGTKITFDNRFHTYVIDLREASRYQYIAYATNAQGTGFSPVADFLTGNTIPIELGGNIPTVVTQGGQSTGTTSLLLNGNIINDGGGGGIEERGFYLGRQNTQQALVANNDPIVVPIVGGLLSLNASSESLYIASALNLNQNTLYYLVAYARNARGVGYGDVKSIATQASAAVPIVQNAPVSDIGSNGATIGGQVNFSQGSLPTSIGVAYKEFAVGDTSQSIYNEGTRENISTFSVDLGTRYTADITGLDSGTYYVMTFFATNLTGLGVSSAPFHFTTLPEADRTSRPVVTTNPWTPMQMGTLNLFGGLRGFINDGGGRAITEYGFYYSTTNPGTDATALRSGTKVVEGTSASQTGTFIVYQTYLPEFSNGSTYYYTAFATNSLGESLGGVQSFTASGLYDPNDTPLFDTTTTVTTGVASNVDQITATLNGSWTIGAGRTVNRQGYFISSSETAAQGLIDNGFFIAAEDNTHISVLDQGSNTQLEPNTRYYYMAYVSLTNGEEIMGSVENFLTLQQIQDQLTLSRNSIRSSETNTSVHVTVAPTDAGFTFINNSRSSVTKIGSNLVFTNISPGTVLVRHGRNSSIVKTISITEGTTTTSRTFL